MIKKEERISTIAFVLLTFAIAWFCCGILYIGERTGVLNGDAGYVITYALIGFGIGCAPTYAVYILLKRANAIRGLGDFFKRIHSAVSIPRMLAFTALCSGIVFAQHCFVSSFSGRRWYECLLYLPIMLVGGGFEEVGWRGVLQPQLEKKLPFPLAATATGLLWAAWHIPLFFLSSSGQFGKNFLAFVCLTIALSFLLAALYKATKCVFACMLLHAWNNSLGRISCTTTIRGCPAPQRLSCLPL